MIHLDNAGSAREIGRRHGASCPRAVRIACEARGRSFRIEEAGAEAGVRLVVGASRALLPEPLAEVQGRADASGMTRAGGDAARRSA